MGVTCISGIIFGMENQKSQQPVLTSSQIISQPYFTSPAPSVFYLTINTTQNLDTAQHTATAQTSQTNQETTNTQEQEQKQEQSAVQEALQTIKLNMQTLMDMHNTTQQQLHVLQQQQTHVEHYLSQHSGVPLLLGCLCAQSVGFYVLGKRINRINTQISSIVHTGNNSATSIKKKRRKKISLAQRLSLIKKRLSQQQEQCAIQARVYLNKLSTLMHELLVC